MSYIGKQPIRTALTSSDIEDGVITAAKIEDGTVVASEIASNAITTAKINADAVTGAKIADDAINSEHYTDGSVDTAHIADANVTSAKIAGDAITAAKIADNAISEEHLDVTAITGHTAETSIADGDTILIHDASASALRKMTKANFVSGVGGNNQPYFAATSAAHSSLADNTWFKVNFTSEVVDSDGKYDASNAKFTPTVAGWYQCNLRVLLYNATDDMRSESNVAFYKNGSNNGNNNSNAYRNGGGLFYFVTPHKQSIIYLDTDDYLEAYARPNAADGSTAVDGGGCMFSAFRLI